MVIGVSSPVPSLTRYLPIPVTASLITFFYFPHLWGISGKMPITYYYRFVYVVIITEVRWVGILASPGKQF